jgi:hypothetical protein
MARLWRDQGKQRQAHDLLAPIYRWFTEGFDTLDLQEAKARLDQLVCGSSSPRSSGALLAFQPGHPFSMLACQGG